MLMVCETDRAAARYAERRGEIPMLVAVRRAIVRGFQAGKRVWKWNQETTDITYLTTMRLWDGPERERLNYLFSERMQ